MPTPRVIDLSHHNSIPKDLMAAKEAGIIGCIHKLTEGTGFVDSKVEARSWLAHEAGMAWGVYHFLRPGDMLNQAEFFFNTARDRGVIDNDTVLVADHEDQDVSGEQLKQFLDAIEDMAERSPVVYSGHVLKEQLAGSGYRPKRRLWLCHYAATPVLPEGVDAYWLWQYTDKGSIGGIEPVDLNSFEGDAIAFLDGWAGRHDEQPEPEPDYAPTITLSSDVPVALKIVAGNNVTLR